MIFLELFLGFFKVSCFTFGGAYGAIPLIRDQVMAYGWMDEETLAYMIAVGESTPGPIMVNLATYIGSTKAGFLGSVLATFAVVLPAFMSILLITVLLKNVIKNSYVQAVLRGLKPCVVGIVLATGVYMIVRNCMAVGNQIHISVRAVIVTAMLFGVKFAYQHYQKKKMSPIVLIMVSAVIGIVIYSG